jgi:two-component system phosphate regulon sensor histidine kinase PhoR
VKTTGKIRLLAILMSISVVGVMAIQYLWLTNAIMLKSEAFERSVNRALASVATDLEKKHTLGYISDKLHEDSLMKISFSDKGEEQFYEFIMDEKNGSEKNVISGDDNGSVKIQISRVDPDHRGTVQHTVRISTNSNTGEPGITVNKSFEEERVEIIPAAANIAGPVTPVSPPATPEPPALPGEVVVDPATKKVRFLNLVNDMADEYALCSEGWGQIADSMAIRESINKEFERRNLPQDFRFAVYNSADDTLLFDKNDAWQNDITVSPYKAALLPFDMVSDNSYLLVDFPQKSSYIFWSLSGLMFLSLLFTLVIISSFAYSMYVIITQKKLGEITNDFINNMTHELKTPLATISMTADTLNMQNVQEDKARISEYAGMIKGEAKRLAKQVDRILGAALWDKTGSSSAAVESINIVDITHEVIASFETLIAQKGGEIEIQSSHEQLFVVANRDILSIVISNLLDNSIKYTPEKPHIKIDIRQGGLNVVLSIKDNGIGISRKDKEMIFEKFYRVSQGNRHDVKGYGLGLSFVKTAIEERGGKVWVESELGRGATFFITLPLA